MVRKKSGEVKMSLQEWLNNISDNNLHHLGEYFTYLTGKPFQTKACRATKRFFEWLEKNYYPVDVETLMNSPEVQKSLERFDTYSSKFGEGFFFRRR